MDALRNSSSGPRASSSSYTTYFPPPSPSTGFFLQNLHPRRSLFAFSGSSSALEGPRNARHAAAPRSFHAALPPFNSTLPAYGAPKSAKVPAPAIAPRRTAYDCPTFAPTVEPRRTPIARKTHAFPGVIVPPASASASAICSPTAFLVRSNPVTYPTPAVVAPSAARA
eukprot:29456-Pelagococcus_subviridis.AAC.5